MSIALLKREKGWLRKWSGAAGAALCLATTLNTASAQMMIPALVSLKPYNNPWASANRAFVARNKTTIGTN